jgi:nucleoside-diphosphate-sugar epimerase
MRLCIIGGTLFAGKAFVEQAVASGHDVTVVSRGRAPVPCAEHVRHVVCDRRELTVEKLPYRAYDAVIDQVAFDATAARLIIPVIERVAARYICTSSMSVYSPGANIREDAYDPHAHVFERDVDARTDYSEAKRQLEAVIAATCPVPWITVRFSMIVSEDDPTGRWQWHRDRVRDRLPIYMPSPDARMSFVHAHDAGRILVHCCTADLHGPLNATDPTPIPVGDVVRGFASRFGVEPVWADEPTEENYSPYGIEEEWWMNTEKLVQSRWTVDSGRWTA